MKLILAGEAMEACARWLEEVDEQHPGMPRGADWQRDAALAIYQAAAVISAQPGIHPEGTDYRIPVPNWLASRVFG